jgi:hypothetical protein
VNIKAIFTKNAGFVFSSTYSCTCYHFLPFWIVLFGVWSLFSIHTFFFGRVYRSTEIIYALLIHSLSYI